jgi:hypothetical protein
VRKRGSLEHGSDSLLPHTAFIARVAQAIGLGVFMLVVPLAIGMWGYHHFQELSWDDAFVNAAMILSGMGPLAAPQTRAAKLFEGLYALFSGFVFLTVAGVVLAPFVHRVLHRFHLERNPDER